MLPLDLMLRRDMFTPLRQRELHSAVSGMMHRSPDEGQEVHESPSGRAVITPVSGKATETVYFKVHGALTEIGWYELKLFNFEANVEDIADLTEGHLGTLPDDPDAIGWFAPDIGAVEHGLSDDALMAGKLIAYIEYEEDILVPLVLIFPGTGGGDAMGQYQGMGHRMVTDSVDGFDWDRFTPIIG